MDIMDDEKPLPPNTNEPSDDPFPSILGVKLIHNLVGRAYDELHSLAYTLPSETLAERRNALLEYVRHTRARFIRAIVALVWLIDDGHSALMEGAQRALSSTQRLSNRDLFSQRRWSSDIPAALDVLMGGGYPRLPHGIQNCGSVMPRKPLWLYPRDRQKLTEALNKAIRLDLIFMKPIPSALTQCTLSGGLIRLVAPGRISFALTLDSIHAGARWILCKIKCLVKAREGESVTLPVMDTRQRMYLMSIIKKAMDDCYAPSGMVVPDSSEEKEDKKEDMKLLSPPLGAMSEYTRQKATKKREDSILVAYDLLHLFSVKVHLELLVGQAIALSKGDGLWGGRLSVTYHRESFVLDVSMWNEECSAGIAGTGGGVPMEGGNAEPVNGINPPIGRFVRIYIGRASEGSDGDGSLCGLHIQLGREWEVYGNKLVSDASDLVLDPGSVSMSRILMDAARAFINVKVKATIIFLGPIVKPFGTCTRAELVPGYGSKVIVSIASDTGEEDKMEEWAQFHLRLDVRGGRWSVLGGIVKKGEEEYAGLSMKSLPYMNLSEALNLRPSASEQKNRLADAVKQALEFTARLHAENLVKRVLNVEPQERWGVLLGQEPSPDFLSYNIYVPLDSDFEPAHQFQGEQLYFILQVIIRIVGCSSTTEEEPFTVGAGKLSIDDTMLVGIVGRVNGTRNSMRHSVSTTLLVATVPESNQSIVPKVIHTKILSCMTAGNDKEVEECLRGAFDAALQFIPWVRLDRAMGIVSTAFSDYDTKPEKAHGELKLFPLVTSLHSPPALGKWVDVYHPHVEIALVRWMGHVLGWEWKVRLSRQMLPPEWICPGLSFSGEKLMHQLSSHSLPDGRRYSLLKGLTIKVLELNENGGGGRGENERNGAQLFLNLQCDTEVPLQAQCGLIAGNYFSAAAILAGIVEEARNLMGERPLTKAEDDEYYVTDVNQFCIIMARGDGNGGVSLSHNLVALHNHPRCTDLAEHGKGGLLLTLPPDIPECLGKELSKLLMAPLGSIKELINVLSQTVQPAQMVTKATREWFVCADGPRTLAVVCSFCDHSKGRRSVAFYFGSKSEGITVRGTDAINQDKSWVRQCTLKEFASVLRENILFLTELATASAAAPAASSSSL